MLFVDHIEHVVAREGPSCKGYRNTLAGEEQAVYVFRLPVHRMNMQV